MPVILFWWILDLRELLTRHGILQGFPGIRWYYVFPHSHRKASAPLIMTVWTPQPTNGNNNHHTLRGSPDFWFPLLLKTEIRQFSPIWTDFIHQCICVPHLCTEERLARFSSPVFKEHVKWLVFFLGEALPLIWAWTALRCYCRVGQTHWHCGRGRLLLLLHNLKPHFRIVQSHLLWKPVYS